jgi:hypothetical protein
LDLLRFAGATPSAAIHGLDRLFEGVGVDIEPYIPPNSDDEWMVLEKQYNFAYHTAASPRDFDKEGIRKIEQTKLHLLRGNFLAQLNRGQRFFVFVDKLSLSEAEVLPLFLALRRRSDAWMLWIQLAGNAAEVGEVRLVLPGFIKGFLARFAPEFDGTDVSRHVWLNILANAWLLRLRLSGTVRSIDDGMPATDSAMTFVDEAR